MGSLFNQDVRKLLTVTFNDIESELLELQKLSTKMKVTLDQTIKVREILELKRKNNLYVANGDIFDEQMEGFGNLLDIFIVSQDK